MVRTCGTEQISERDLSTESTARDSDRASALTRVRSDYPKTKSRSAPARKDGTCRIGRDAALDLRAIFFFRERRPRHAAVAGTAHQHAIVGVVRVELERAQRIRAEDAVDLGLVWPQLGPQ